jgi:hypothetical protein
MSINILKRQRKHGSPQAGAPADNIREKLNEKEFRKIGRFF